MASTEERLSDIESDVEEMQEQETDIFKQQDQTISLLTDVLQNKIQSSSAPTYVTQAAPKSEKPAPNYAMMIGGGLLLWFLLKGKK